MSLRTRLPLLPAILAVAGLLATLAHGQTDPAPAKPPPQHPPGAATLTPEQLAKVKSVLAAYKPASLTVEQARTIKRAFRDAGQRPGPGLADALHTQGFSAQKLEQLDPRPPGPPPGERPGDRPGEGPGGRPDGPPPPRGDAPAATKK